MIIRIIDLKPSFIGFLGYNHLGHASQLPPQDTTRKPPPFVDTYRDQPPQTDNVETQRARRLKYTALLALGPRANNSVYVTYCAERRRLRNCRRLRHTPWNTQTAGNHPGAVRPAIGPRILEGPDRSGGSKILDWWRNGSGVAPGRAGTERIERVESGGPDCAPIVSTSCTTVACADNRSLTGLFRIDDELMDYGVGPHVDGRAGGAGGRLVIKGHLRIHFVGADLNEKLPLQISCTANRQGGGCPQSAGYGIDAGSTS